MGKLCLVEIMLSDSKFNDDYAYTGLISPTKQVNNAYWLPRNISVCVLIVFHGRSMFVYLVQ